MKDITAFQAKTGDVIIARNGQVLKNDYRRGNDITIIDVKPDKNPNKIQLFFSFCSKRTDKNTQTLAAKFSKSETITIK